MCLSGKTVRRIRIDQFLIDVFLEDQSIRNAAIQEIYFQRFAICIEINHSGRSDYFRVFSNSNAWVSGATLTSK